MADHQAVIAAGVGFRADCTAQDIVAAVTMCIDSQCPNGERIGALCTADFKSSAEQLTRAARELGLRVLSFSRAALERHASQALTSSPLVQELYALPSIAETAALAGAFELSGGARSVRLLGSRRVIGAATCALASVVEPSA